MLKPLAAHFEGQSGSIFATSELLLLRSPRQMLMIDLMKLSVPAQANISDCVDKGVLSLTAAGVQLVAQHRASAMGMWQSNVAGLRPATRRRGGSGRAGRSDDGDDGACLRGGLAAATAAPAAP